MVTCRNASRKWKAMLVTKDEEKIKKTLTLEKNKKHLWRYNNILFNRVLVPTPPAGRQRQRQSYDSQSPAYLFSSPHKRPTVGCRKKNISLIGCHLGKILTDCWPREKEQRFLVITCHSFHVCYYDATRQVSGIPQMTDRSFEKPDWRFLFCCWSAGCDPLRWWEGTRRDATSASEMK